MQIDQQGKTWDARNYILAALGGSLAAIAMVIIVSVILSPARMSFSVTDASRSISSDPTTSSGGAGVDLRFTVSANTRQRCRATKVKFLSFLVVLANGTSESSALFQTEARLDAPGLPEGYLPVSGQEVIMRINASVHLLPGGLATSFTARRSGFIVEVTSVVRFRIGVAATRIYDVKVTCPGVVFTDKGSKTPAAPSFSCNG